MSEVSKTNDLVSCTYQYEIIPTKLIILYKKGQSLIDVHKLSIVDFPILMSMEKPDEHCLSMVYKSDISNDIYLFIDSRISYSIIAHECVHITSRMFDCIGSPINESTEEFFAYILDYTFEQVVKFCKEELKLKLK